MAGQGRGKTSLRQSRGRIFGRDMAEGAGTLAKDRLGTGSLARIWAERSRIIDKDRAE